MKTYIGIDNGVSSNGLAILSEDKLVFHPMPIKKQLNYTKTKAHITRIDTAKLKELLKDVDPLNSLVLMERPMVNPTRFKATVSGVRALEATLIVVEDLKLPYQYVDSKEWQREILPKGLEGSDELKAASLDVGTRLFPSTTFKKDADSALMAEWARRKKL